MKNSILYSLLLLAPFLLLAQVEYGGQPLSFSIDSQESLKQTLRNATGIQTVAHPTNSQLYDQARANEPNEDVVGHLLDVQLSFYRDAERIKVGDFYIYRLKITSQRATHINLLFNKFRLSKGTQLYFYNESLNNVFGSFNSKNNHKSEVFTSPRVEGESIIMELVEPVDAKKSQISLFKVAHYFEDEVQKANAIKAAGACHIDINCTEGDNWQVEKKGVVKIWSYTPSNSVSHVSGSLINSTGDRKSLILTARHNLPVQANPAAFFWLNFWQFEFHYEAETCGGSDDSSDNHFISDAKLISMSVEADMALLEVDEEIPESYNVVYNGWNANSTIPTSITGIHHPDADVKKIAISNSSPQTINAFLTGVGQVVEDLDNPLLTDFKLSWDDGITEGNASGSPAFDQNHLIVGQLRGGLSNCSGVDGPDYYGRLSVAWENYSTITNPSTGNNLISLKAALDPADELGNNPSAGDLIVNTFSSSSDLFVTMEYCDLGTFSGCNFNFSPGQSVFFNAIVGGGAGNYTYSWNFGDGTIQGGGPITTHSYSSSGAYTVALTVTDGGQSKTTYATIFIGSSTTPYINANFTISDNYITAGDPPVVFTNTSTSNLNLEDASFYWDFGAGANPRYAYTEGPHTVCYSNLKQNRNVLLDIQYLNTNITGSTTKNVTVIDDQSAACQQAGWVTTPGANVIAAQDNCYWPEIYGYPEGDLEGFSCTLDNGSSFDFLTCAFEPSNSCFDNTLFQSHGSIAIGDFDTEPYSNSPSHSFFFGAAGIVDINSDEPIIGSEGLVYQHPTKFRFGESYRFFFHAKTVTAFGTGEPTLDILKIALTDGLVNSSCYSTTDIDDPLFQMPNYSFSYYELGQFQSAVNETWSCFVVSFSPPNDDFDQIWIYPWLNESELPRQDINNLNTLHESYIFLDNIDVVPLTDECATDIVLNSQSDIQSYQAKFSIETEGNITIDSSDPSITFSAGESIVLKPGFHAVAGSNFTADMSGCGSASGRVSREDQMYRFSQNNTGPNFPTTSVAVHQFMQDALEDDLEELFIYPSVSDGMFRLTTEKSNTIEVYSLDGNLIKSLSEVSDSSIDLRGLLDGIYVIRVREGATIIQSQKVIIKK